MVLFVLPRGLLLNQCIVARSLSVLHVLSAQQTANSQLPTQAQQNTAKQLAHNDALRTLTKSTEQRNFNHILNSIPLFMVQKGGFFEWCINVMLNVFVLFTSLHSFIFS